MKRLARPWLSAQVLGALALALGGLHAANPTSNRQSSPPGSAPTRLTSGIGLPPSLDLTDETHPPRRLQDVVRSNISAEGIDVPAPSETDHLLVAAAMPRPSETQPVPRQLQPQPSHADAIDASGVSNLTVSDAPPRRLTLPSRPVSDSAAKPAPALKPVAPDAIDTLKPTPITPRDTSTAKSTPITPRVPAVTAPPVDSQPLAAPGPASAGPVPSAPALTPPIPVEIPEPAPGPTLVVPPATPATAAKPSETTTPALSQPAEPKQIDKQAPASGPTLAAPALPAPPASTDKPSADKPGTDKPAAEKPAADKVAADKVATDKPAAAQPATPVVTPKAETPKSDAAKSETAPTLTPPTSPDSGGSSKGNVEPRNVPAIDGPMPPMPMPKLPTLPPAPTGDAGKEKSATEKGSTETAPAKPDATKPATPGKTEPGKADSGKTETSKSEPEKPAPEPRDPLLTLVDQAIEVTTQRKLRLGVNSPWQIVHGVVALRWDMRIETADGKGSVSAIEWLMGGNKFEGQSLWLATQWGGRGHPYTRPYAHEGHPTQFLGYMTMANIPLDYEVQTDTKLVTVRDIINDAKMQVRQGPEITWTLWALAHYEEPDAQWYNSAGEAWSIERLVKMQVDEQVIRGACGGCHGLFALCYARNIYLTQGHQLRGVWVEADNKIRTHVEYSRRMQNRDGSFSSNFYKGPGFSSDFSTRLNTTGHQLEWIMVALPQSRLKEQWVRNAVECLARDLIINAKNPSDTGPMYHSLHSLILYRQRLDPNYLIPKRNSPLKLIERNRAEPIAKQPGEAQAAAPRTTPAPVAATAPAASATEGLKPVDAPGSLKALPVSGTAVRPLPRGTGSAAAVDGRDTEIR